MSPGRVAAGLLWLSALSHISQIWVYPGEASVPGAAFFGLIYAGIGFGLWRGGRQWAWAGVILPTLGGTLGILRFLYAHPNPFSIFHVAIDLVVIGICIWLLRTK